MRVLIIAALFLGLWSGPLALLLLGILPALLERCRSLWAR